MYYVCFSLVRVMQYIIPNNVSFYPLYVVLKGLAYPVNGIIMGGLDWKFTMFAMWASNVVCLLLLRLSGNMTLNKIWYSLAAFMGTQVVTGLIRVQSRTGVWKVLK
jgi:hypothetical protein